MTLLLSCLPPTPTLPPLFFSKRSSVPLTSIPHHQPGPLGGLLASVVLDKLGRKFVIILINVLSIVAWSIQSWTDKEDAQTMFYQLLVARLIIGQCPTTFFGKRRIMRIIPTGIAAGLSSSPVTVYAAEIAHPRIRGRLTVLSSVFISFGVLVIYFLGFLIQVIINLSK